MIAGVPYDAEIEYLESTGAQYIDTAYVPNRNTAVQFDLQLTTLAKDWTVCTGRRAIVGTDTFFYVQIHLPDKWYIVIGNNQNIIQIPLTSPNSRHSIGASVRDSRIVVDGRVFPIPNTYGGVNDYTLNIFGNIKADGTMADGQPMKLYKYYITDDDTLVRDYIPVRVGSGANAVGYMYDRVTRKMFGNAGTGAFVLGPDVATPVMGIYEYPETIADMI